MNNQPTNKRGAHPTKQKASKKGRKRKDTNEVGSFTIPLTGKTMKLFKQIIPPRVFTKLRYLTSAVLTNAIGTSASRQMNANGIYDVDPALGSTAVPGFVEYMTFYDRFRVYQVSQSCEFANNETFPLQINMSFEPTFYAANGKTLGYFSSATRNVTKLITRGNGGPIEVLSLTAKVGDIVGDDASYTSLNYSGTTAANPAALIYATTAISTGTATLLVSGVLLRWSMEFIVEFFERRPLFQ